MNQIGVAHYAGIGGPLSRNTQLKAKITGELAGEKPVVVINVQQSQEFILVRGVIFSELEDYPEVRTRISKRLRVLADTGTDPGS